MTVSKTHTGGSHWWAVALPLEHGGWAFISEPIMLGLLVAPSWSGIALCIMAFAAFLLRQPLKLVLKDMRARRSTPRTALARRFALIYSSGMIVAGIVALITMPSPHILLPLMFAIPLLGVQLWLDVRGQGRFLLAELIGVLAPGAIASTLVLIGTWSLMPALTLWVALIVKGVTAVLYIRSRLRLERGKKSDSELAIAAHGFGLLLLLISAGYKLLPWTAPVAMVILLARACIGLSPLRKARPAKSIGIQEIGYGLMFVLLTALGYKLGLFI